MAKIKLLFAIAIFCQAFAQAQITLGMEVKAGVTGAGLYDNAAPNYYTRSVAGVQLGTLISADFPSGIALETGLMYMGKNFAYDFKKYPSESKRKDGTYLREQVFNNHYLEIPFNIAYRLRARKLRFVWKAGPYIATNFAANTRETWEHYKDSLFTHVSKKKYTRHIGSKSTDDVKLFDVGFNIGTGIEVERFTIGIQYGVGLMDILPSNEAEYLKNRVFVFAVGFRIK